MYLRIRETGEVLCQEDYRKRFPITPKVLTKQVLGNLGVDPVLPSPRLSVQDPLQKPVVIGAFFNKGMWFEQWGSTDRFIDVYKDGVLVKSKEEQESEHLEAIRSTKRPKDVFPVYSNGSEHSFHLFKVGYLDRGTPLTRFSSNKEQSLSYYVDYDDVTGFTTETFIPSSDQQSRLDIINSLVTDTSQEYLEYITYGSINPDTTDSHLIGLITPDTTSAYTDYVNKEYIDAINSIRKQKEYTGVPFEVGGVTHRFSSDPFDGMGIKFVAADIKSGDVSYIDGTGGYWRSIDNVEVTMTELEFLSMSSSLTTYFTKLARESHRVKSLIKDATDTTVKQQLVEDYRNYDPLSP